MSGRDEELERLRAAVSCATVLEKIATGWALDRLESTKRALKYRRGNGEIVIVNHDGRGWWDPLSDAKGDVFNLAQHLDRGLNFGQIRQTLRPLAGIASAYPAFEPTRRRDTKVAPVGERWEGRRCLHHGSRTWRYLFDTRALPASVLAAAAVADAVREGPHGSAWFAHRDHDGTLTGIEMRGPNYRGFSPNSHKTLFRLPGSHGTITRLAVFEAPIDAMSLAALERIRPDTLYVATAGGMGPYTIEALTHLLGELTKQSCAQFVIATDADAAGERYADQLRQMGAVAGVPSERLAPSAGYKDWNRFLQTQAGRDTR